MLNWAYIVRLSALVFLCAVHSVSDAIYADLGAILLLLIESDSGRFYSLVNMDLLKDLPQLVDRGIIGKDFPSELLLSRLHDFRIVFLLDTVFVKLNFLRESFSLDDLVSLR